MNDDAGTRERALDFGGIWWRSARYEIQDGLIGPVPAALIDSYDPWAAYSQARTSGGGGGDPSPYAALLELIWRVRLLPSRPQGKARLTPESESLILDWCAAHGLLGILLQETEAVSYAARWGNAELGEDGGREGVLQPIRTTYRWTGSVWDIAGWTERKEPWSLPADPRHSVPFGNEDDIYEGNVVCPELVSERWRPEVLVSPMDNGAHSMRPLGPAWGPFFPRVRPDARSHNQYPWPGSERWWGEYAEPVDRFLDAADLFFDALTTLEPGADRHEAWGVRHAGLPTGGQILLHGLLQSVRPILFRSSDGDWVGGWRAKSLLSSYAVMAYLDLIDGKRVLACDTCGKPYVSGAYQARYCSDRCRNTALKRAYRVRTRQGSKGGIRP